jgi:hypothetical protein
MESERLAEILHHYSSAKPKILLEAKRENKMG